MFDSPGLNEDVCVGGIEHEFTDELLGDWDGRLIRHTEIGEVVQESAMVDSTH